MLLKLITCPSALRGRSLFYINKTKTDTVFMQCQFYFFFVISILSAERKAFFYYFCDFSSFDVGVIDLYVVFEGDFTIIAL